MGTIPISSITVDDHESGKYKWNKKQCKVFLLYCNQSPVRLTNVPSERKTSEFEISNLKERLKLWLGKDVVKFKDFHNFGTELKNKLCEEIANAAENEKYDCFIFIVLTIGVQDRLFCWDGEISITDILEAVKKEPSMALKPKVFFIQCSDESLAEKPVITKAGAVPSVSEKYRTISIPREADVFILQCILPESLFPVNDEINECIFVTALMETMEKAKTQLDIHQLSIQVIAAVNERLQREHNKSKEDNKETVDFNSLPVPEVTSTLTKALYFPFQSQC
ncbi:hypothetical protein ACJMK2_042544 [Sinanodonta woodiana]|uniref:Peptidase C14A caspase catalytic domain-containing protein n=1 Tax=Sinanodonta woodiana TaxID=1069815 RepID=A0ABD3W7R4_SINWO